MASLHEFQSHKIPVEHATPAPAEVAVRRGPIAERLGRFSSKLGLDAQSLADAGVLRSGEAQAAEAALQSGQVDSLSSIQAARATALQRSPDYRSHPH